MATKQAYFAVAVNDDGTMYLDNDMPLMTEDNMPIWNEETELWEDISEDEGFYDEAHAQLQRTIAHHNLLITTRLDN
jgi:hypothetical protein